MNKIKDQLNFTLDKINLDGYGDCYKGKVRDNYYNKEKILMVTTDRVSAFDHVLGTIPFKGEILTQIAKFWFNKTKSIAPNHFIDDPDPQVMLAHKAETLPVEVIVRGYITGSLWRDYLSGESGRYGVEMPGNMLKNQQFLKPILTPTTKAEYGEHDAPISRGEIIDGIVDKAIYEKAEEYALNLFKEGQEWADKRGLILVDTKYEFGMVNGELILIDEIHTPDSSRYWISDRYQEKFDLGEDQLMLDKENIRQWLIEKGFSGEGIPPELSDDIKISLSESYMDLFRKLTGSDFNPTVGDVSSRINDNLKNNLIF